MQAAQAKVYVGFDSRLPDSYMVTVRSIRRYAPNVVIKPLLLPHLIGEGLYTRPTTKKGEVLHDEISGAAMSTEFAISRFLIPHLSGFKGISIFCDGDFMFRDDIRKLARLARPQHAVSVVKHEYEDKAKKKMGGQPQQNYPRKNWSSLMVFNNEHPDLKALTPAYVNSMTGRALHSLQYIPDENIGSLPVAWNWLEGHSPDSITPKAVHYTRGTPDLKGYENAAFADEWRKIREEIPCEI